MTPTTVKSDSPGIKVSVIDGAPSKKVCSGTMAAVGDGPLTFSLGAFDFLGRNLDGCGLYAQRGGCSMRNDATFMGERSSWFPEESANEDAKLAVTATRRRERRLRVRTGRTQRFYGSVLRKKGVACDLVHRISQGAALRDRASRLFHPMSDLDELSRNRHWRLLVEGEVRGPRFYKCNCERAGCRARQGKARPRQGKAKARQGQAKARQGKARQAGVFTDFQTELNMN